MQERVQEKLSQEQSRSNLSVSSVFMSPKAEYKILEIGYPAVFFGTLDLSSLKHGDSVEIVIRLSAGAAKQGINFRRTFSGPLPDPLIDIPERYGSSINVSLTQLTGEHCEVYYDLRWRKL